MTRDDFYVASLLHDIGKFLQRSGAFWVAEPLRQHAQYAHAAFSAQLVANLLDTHPLCNQAVRDLVWLHHSKNPMDVYAKLLQIADWLSSGERRAAADDEVTTEFAKAPLQSIFTHLFQMREKSYHHLAVLNVDEYPLFPKKSVEVDPQRYREMLDGFLQEFSAIKNDQQLYFLLEKYLWAIPSATPNVKSRSRADISLFDHCRTTAAIALCLYDQYQAGALRDETIQNIEFSKLDERPAFLLVGGDFSGVQDFIYNIGSQGAAKSLKGRSFYLDLLDEIICQYLVRTLELKEANILYNGGANFYLLAPYGKRPQLEEARRRLSRLLYRAHHGSIYLAVSWVELSMQHFLPPPYQTAHPGISEMWRLVGERLGLQKLQRYRELGYENVFQAQDNQGLPECPICHGDMEKARPIDTEKGDHACAMCRSFVALTQLLKKAEGIQVHHLSESGEPSEHELTTGYQQVLKALGFQCKLTDRIDHSPETICFNHTDFLPGRGFRFGAFRIAEGDFDALAKKSKGANKLALLKMDVDNLGRLLQTGLPVEDISISRIAAISRELRLFFEGYLARLLQSAEYWDKIYPVYAGGDDTLLVGAWDQVIKLAAHIRRQFSKFVGGNDEITLSAGIVIVDEKFPIIRSTGLVEEALHRAKHYEEGKKDKICLFDFVFTWDEFDHIIRIKDKLVSLIDRGEPRAILNKVMKSTAGFEKLLQSAGTGKLKTEKVWRFAYYVGRSKHHSEKYREIDAMYDDLLRTYEKILFDCMTGQKQINHIMILPAACRLAELATRKKSK